MLPTNSDCRIFKPKKMGEMPKHCHFADVTFFSKGANCINNIYTTTCCNIAIK